MSFKVFAITLLLAALTSAGHIDRDAQITQQHSEVNYDGTYTNSFQTSNGIGYQESGKGGQVSNGVSQYYDPQGQLHETSWVADANGYRASGADIPTPPPVPSYILRALEYIRLHPYVEKPQKQQGQWQNTPKAPSTQLFF